MSKISEVFQRGQKAFIPYITAGYPDPDTAVALGIACAENGADILELGIPYSDPLADGPVIQASFQAALDAGVNLGTCFDIAGRIKQKTGIPIVFMIAYNLVYRTGIERFAEQCVLNSVDGVIIPDLPPEAAAAEHGIFAGRGIDMVFLVAPNTPPARRKFVFKYSSGYLYCLSRLGITGTQAKLAGGLDKYLAGLRKTTALPLCVGFGISRPEHARSVCAYADGVIVGSAIVKMVTDNRGDREKMLREVGAYVKSMKSAAMEAGSF